MREQEQISYEEICKLEFTVEESNCDSFFKDYGFPYKIFYLHLTKKIYIDWDQVTRVCKLVRINKESSIQAERQISNLAELKDIIDFFTSKQ
tara:strand:+ start:1023 stop:1298 length:276 start_codon:yes stop_codon:yes gene_type:complete